MSEKPRETLHPGRDANGGQEPKKKAPRRKKATAKPAEGEE